MVLNYICDIFVQSTITDDSKFQQLNKTFGMFTDYERDMVFGFRFLSTDELKEVSHVHDFDRKMNKSTSGEIRDSCCEFVI